MVSFSDAIRLFISRATDFQGRSTRAEYWWVQLGFILAYVVFGILFVIFGGMGALETGQLSAITWIPIILFGLFVLAVIIPGIALIIRRFHDVGLSGWWYLGMIVASLIPILGIIASFGPLIVSLMPSKPEINKWGPPSGQGHVADTFS